MNLGTQHDSVNTVVPATYQHSAASGTSAGPPTGSLVDLSREDMCEIVHTLSCGQKGQLRVLEHPGACKGDATSKLNPLKSTHSCETLSSVCLKTH